MEKTFTLNYRECREVYVSYFGTNMPTGMTFKDAAQEVYDRAGATEFRELLAATKALHRTEDEHKVELGKKVV